MKAATTASYVLCLGVFGCSGPEPEALCAKVVEFNNAAGGTNVASKPVGDPRARCLLTLKAVKKDSSAGYQCVIRAVNGSPNADAYHQAMQQCLDQDAKASQAFKRANLLANEQECQKTCDWSSRPTKPIDVKYGILGLSINLLDGMRPGPPERVVEGELAFGGPGDDPYSIGSLELRRDVPRFASLDAFVQAFETKSEPAIKKETVGEDFVFQFKPDVASLKGIGVKVFVAKAGLVCQVTQTTWYEIPNPEKTLVLFTNMCRSLTVKSDPRDFSSKELVSKTITLGKQSATLQIPEGLKETPNMPNSTTVFGGESDAQPRVLFGAMGTSTTETQEAESARSEGFTTRKKEVTPNGFTLVLEHPKKALLRVSVQHVSGKQVLRCEATQKLVGFSKWNETAAMFTTVCQSARFTTDDK